MNSGWWGVHCMQNHGKNFKGRLSGTSLLLIPADAECIVCNARERILGTLVWSVPFINSGWWGMRCMQNQRKKCGDACLERPFY